MADFEISKTTEDDIPALRQVVHETALFPSNLLPDMVAHFLSGTSPEIWFTCRNADGPVGFCFCTPEMLTEGTWNMTAIAVAPGQQGKGFGTALVRALEEELRSKQQRLLIVDTSSLEEFDGTRAFYARNGYDEEARIREYWGPGDDKVTFRKLL